MGGIVKNLARTKLKAIVGQYATRIDRTDLGLVRQYLQSPLSEIQQVLVVSPEIPLAEVGALADFANPTLSHDERFQQITILLRQGLVWSLTNTEAIRPNQAPSETIPLSNETVCDVLYLPPCYVIQFASNEW